MDMVREKKGDRFNVSEKQDSGWPGLDTILVQTQSQKPASKTGIEANIFALKDRSGAARDRKTVILSVLDSCKNGQVNLASDAARLMIANLIDAALNESDEEVTLDEVMNTSPALAKLL